MSVRLSREEYKALCNSVLVRDGWKCRYCGRRDNLHVHHVLFRSQGGADTMENLITLCMKHHDEIHRRALFIVVVGGKPIFRRK